MDFENDLIVAGDISSIKEDLVAFSEHAALAPNKRSSFSTTEDLIRMMQQQSPGSIKRLKQRAKLDSESSVELLVSQASEESDSSLEVSSKHKDPKARKKMLSPLRKKRYVPWDLHSAKLEEANEKSEQM